MFKVNVIEYVSCKNNFMCNIHLNVPMKVLIDEHRDMFIKYLRSENIGIIILEKLEYKYWQNAYTN